MCGGERLRLAGSEQRDGRVGRMYVSVVWCGCVKVVVVRLMGLSTESEGYVGLCLGPCACHERVGVDGVVVEG